MTSHVVRAFLAAVPATVELLSDPELVRRWDEPSALREMSIGALAEHLGSQITGVPDRLAAPWRSSPTVSLDEYYAQAPWLGAGIDSDANRHIRDEAAHESGEGWAGLHDRLARASTSLPRLLADRPVEATVWMPARGVSLDVDDFLRSRLMEIAVHADDLAVSLGVPTPTLSIEGQNVVIALLGRIAVARHGWAGVLRGLARTERAPAGGIAAL